MPMLITIRLIIVTKLQNAVRKFISQKKRTISWI